MKEFPQETWTSYKNDKVNELVFKKISDAGFEAADLNDELRLVSNSTRKLPVRS